MTQAWFTIPVSRRLPYLGLLFLSRLFKLQSAWNNIIVKGAIQMIIQLIYLTDEGSQSVVESDPEWIGQQCETMHIKAVVALIQEFNYNLIRS